MADSKSSGPSHPEPVSDSESKDSSAKPQAAADPSPEADPSLAEQSPKVRSFSDLTQLGALNEAEIKHLDALSRNLMDTAMKSQTLLAEMMARPDRPGPGLSLETLSKSPDLSRVFEQVVADQDLIMKAQSDLHQGYLDLWSGTVSKLMKAPAEPVIEPAPGDKRWQGEEWTSHPVFDAIKQSYLLNQRFMMSLVEGVRGVEDRAKRRAAFLTQQFMDAMAPTNFALTNPQVLKETYETQGENLSRGLMNLARDLERGKGRLALSQTDMEGFKIGENLATTPGKVIFRNELFELIQYTPRTQNVRRRPLLIAPPWINKFYILDMRAQNSMIAWLLDQGFSLFLMSWVNPGPELAEAGMEDYMKSGLFKALDVTLEVTGEEQADVIGYCIGGTMLGAALAYLAKDKEENRIASATFFAAQLDFEDPGELMVFMEDGWVGEIERIMESQGGVLDGQIMADTFNALRANDLIWSFVVNNYLLGKQPQAFDLLYWNADQTRMPKRLHLAYLNAFYRHNLLSQCKMTLDSRQLDLSEVTVPVFMQASIRDHIAPAASVYRGAKLFGGPTEFMLAGSGHIAGVINHPDANKYQYWSRTDLPGDFEAWKSGATETEGSWWPHWRDWLYRLSDETVAARDPGSEAYPPICEAPGEYVKVRG
ncbi:class I poly(R)-hydroxyalkanoic acid synthase [Marinicauda sp. Alg238-R41]|uniref:class I poly(R)-hydroxyalkanoic acid synthase n=1 Tax=Marinicauda sp. Alg238-R41 TaxID=2993447 RepID=UPI0022E8D5A1|nr:class I poly(R)-hydroxyalkanoic acid synthase [Marinicauda sp. Alg238-R41]